MKIFLLLFYVWGCCLTAEILFDTKSSLYNPDSKLQTIDKVVRVITWPFLVETEAIFLSAKDLSR